MKPTDKRDLTIYNLMDLSDLHPQVLQKLGKTVETKDERFEQSANNFYCQQVIRRVGKGSLQEERRRGCCGRRNSMFFTAAQQRASLLTHLPPGERATACPAACPSSGTGETYLFCSCCRWILGGCRQGLFSLSGSLRVQWRHQILRQNQNEPLPPFLLPRVPPHPRAFVSVAPCFPCGLSIHYLYIPHLNLLF